MANRSYLVLFMAVAGGAVLLGDARLANPGLSGGSDFNRDNLETAARLIRAGAEGNAQARDGSSALAMAAVNEAKMIASLLQAGASVGSANPESETPLMAAARTGKVDAIKQLLDHGADVNAKEDVVGETALMGAVEENHLDAVKLLLERGADINAGTGVSVPPGDTPPAANGGMTALLFAAREGYQEMAALLLDRGADIDRISANRTSPLLTAILNGHIELARKLLDRGADPNAVDAYGQGPLFAAVEIRNLNHELYPDLPPDAGDPTALIHVLVEKGADVNARTNVQGDGFWVNFEGQTAFLRAALSGDVSLMHYLLDHGADPNIGTLGGTSPLMAAAGINYVPGQTYLHPERDYREAIKLCLDQGADINAANSEGFTAMHGAAYRGWESLIQLLADRGARLDVKDKEGRTPMSFAEGVSLAVRPPEAKPGAIALLRTLLANHN